MSKESWDQGFRIEVSVTPEVEVQKSEDELSDQECSEAISTTCISKSMNEERREITCIAMVANEVDAHGDLFTVDAVKGAAEEFLSEYNISKELGIDHSGERPEMDLIGSWYFASSGEVDGIRFPADSWLVKMKVYDDEVWDSIKRSERTGVSIEGPAVGYNIKTSEETEGDEG